MIKHVYASKNKLSGNFNVPMFEDFEKDSAAERYTVTALEHPSEQVKELEMYYLGDFDTKTGEFVGACEFIVDLGAVLNGREATKES